MTHVPKLPWMPNLSNLYLQENQIFAVQPLHGLPSLSIVNISFNRLGQAEELLSAFSLLPNLAELYLNGNPVENDPRYIPDTLISRTILSGAITRFYSPV